MFHGTESQPTDPGPSKLRSSYEKILRFFQAPFSGSDFLEKSLALVPYDLIVDVVGCDGTKKKVVVNRDISRDRWNPDFMGVEMLKFPSLAQMFNI